MYRDGGSRYFEDTLELTNKWVQLPIEFSIDLEQHMTTLSVISNFVLLIVEKKQDKGSTFTDRTIAFGFWDKFHEVITIRSFLD
jgi:hypothetical protein